MDGIPTTRHSLLSNMDRRVSLAMATSPQHTKPADPLHDKDLPQPMYSDSQS